MIYYLVIDIGASSGRHIVGWHDEGVLQTREVYRFPNGMETRDGHLVWDIERLFGAVVSGIRAAFAEFPEIESLSIDTWGVDYILLRGDDPVLPCYAYRDSRMEAAIPEVHRLMPFDALYARTGIQFQPFNTIYQLYDDKLAGRLDGVTDFLMIPEYLMWRLTGVKAREYTNATTTGLVSAASRAFDTEITDALGLPRALFPPLSMPGTILGPLLAEVAAAVGGQTRVMLCATHDTASAVEGIDMAEDAPFLSSGTWSLLGVKLIEPLTDEKSRATNFTNEGGLGYIRYLKNIMGLWIVQCLQKQLGMPFADMAELARTSSFDALFDVNDPRFSAPEDMRAEIIAALTDKPETDADLINCVYHSLAHSYGVALCELEANTGRSWRRLYIAGGGAKNAYLNELTEKYTGKEVTALPIEATALGNLKIQMDSIG